MHGRPSPAAGNSPRPITLPVSVGHAVSALIVTRVRDLDDVDADGLKERPIRAGALATHGKVLLSADTLSGLVSVMGG